MSFAFTPGCGCRCDETPDACLLLDDNFDRADNTDPGADWVEEVGGCDITSGEMVISIGTSQVIATAANPDGANTTITVEFKLSSASATARIFLGWLSSSSYLYATISKTLLTVGAAGGSSDTDSHSLTTGAWYTATLCFLDGLLVGRVIGNSEVGISGLTAPGTRHGLGAGTNTAYFNNFIASKVSDACEDCVFTESVPCSPYCETGFVPRFWRVDISGVVTPPPTDVGDCQTGCDDVNGTYIIDMNTDVLDTGLGEGEDHGCGGWVQGPDLSDCDGAPNTQDGPIYLILFPAYQDNVSPNTRRTKLLIYTTNPSVGDGLGDGATFEHVWGDPATPVSTLPVIPCEGAAMVGLSLDFVETGAACDFSGATVTITPLT